MKPAILTVLAALAAQAAGVPLCLNRLTSTDNFSVSRAQMIVTRVFAEAGVRVEWLSARQCRTAPAGALSIMLEAEGPSQFNRAALGYAQPYGSGTAVHIFYGRIREDHPVDFALILGHAMVHEIGHVLQGIARHSDTGIMKAFWTFRDYSEMRLGRLRFAGEDVQLLHMGLKNPAAGSLAARF